MTKKHKKEIETFLLTALNAHRLLLEQAKLIRDRGISATVRQYGDVIVLKEKELISKIEKVSQIENVRFSFPPHKKRVQVLIQLKDFKERDFDKKALKVIATQYRRQLGDVEKMTPISDKNIDALRYDQIATMQALSQKIDALRQEQEEKHFSMRAKYKAWNRGYIISLILGQFLI